MKLFHHLQYGLAVILGFVGIKMLITDFYKINIWRFFSCNRFCNNIIYYCIADMAEKTSPKYGRAGIIRIS